jgi:hypothetical protein
MPSSNLTWTNKSTNLNPTSTKVERSEGFTFDHANASAPVVLDNNATAGLDPEQANGSYTDTTAEAGKKYSYRVSTMKGAEQATSIESPMTHIEDRVNDLGYPNGAPDNTQTTQYSCSVEPYMHLDVQRLEAGYVAGTNSGLDTSNMTRVTDGYTGFMKHNPYGFAMSALAYSSAPYFQTRDLGDGISQDFFVQPQNKALYPGFIPTQYVAFANGATHFHVVSSFKNYAVVSKSQDPYAQWDDSVGDHVNGVVYGSLWRENITWAALDQVLPSISGMPHAGPDLSTYHGTETLKIIAMRLNNDAASYATGNIQAQLFDGGDVVANGHNQVDRSYHAGTTAGKYGAVGYKPSLTAYNLMGTTYYENLFAEALYFGEALDHNDMNMVFAYLGNKYNVSPTVLTSNDLVN